MLVPKHISGALTAAEWCGPSRLAALRSSSADGHMRKGRLSSDFLGYFRWRFQSLTEKHYLGADVATLRRVIQAVG